MRTLPHLFENNRRWAAERLARDPGFFKRLSSQQAPRHLWIGCADSRVPANEIVGLDPGEVFVHRNVANLVPEGDVNCLSVVQFAVENLRVEHVIVCGHYGCGGVLAALGPAVAEPLEQWLAPLRSLARRHAEELRRIPDERTRWRRFCEMNVRAQVARVAELAPCKRAWEAGRRLFVHGWIYDVSDGLLKDLEITVSEEGSGG